MGAEGNDTGGKDERLREHRIGHFRLQACGGCDCDARIAFATAFTLGDIRICWDGCWCDGGTFCRAAYRYGDSPDFGSSGIGFRLVRVPVR